MSVSMFRCSLSLSVNVGVVLIHVQVFPKPVCKCGHGFHTTV